MVPDRRRGRGLAVFLLSVVLTSCTINHSKTDDVGADGFERAQKPSVQVDQGAAGSSFVGLEDGLDEGSRRQPTEVRGWGNRNQIGNAVFDKFEVRNDDADIAFFALCHPVVSCVDGHIDLPLNSCELLADGNRSCHVASSAGQPYELTIYDGGEVTVAEATAAADVVDTLQR